MDYTALGSAVANGPSSLHRAIVSGRVLQFDADFACYEVADLEQPASSNFKNLLDFLHMKRVMVGADHINAFITLGMKSGREQMATVKQYQENRDPDAPIKVRVRELRNMLANYDAANVTVVVGHFFEADDLLCRYQEAMIAEGKVKDSILMSGDKDLWMVQGNHACPKTGRMWLVKGYGNTEYREVGNVKPKLVGEGTSWFWHQMIMGDKVDNIPGLPQLSNKTMDKYLPLKSRKARPSGATACGEAKAVAILDGVKDHHEAARRTWFAYSEYYGAEAKERLVEQAYLLWMQRGTNEWDCIKYLEEAGIKCTPTPKQLAVVEEFRAKHAGRL